MPVTVRCPHCNKAAKIADELRGRKVRCPACREPFAVDADPPAEPARERQKAATRSEPESAEVPAKKSAAVPLLLLLGLGGLVLVMLGGGITAAVLWSRGRPGAVGEWAETLESKKAAGSAEFDKARAYFPDKTRGVRSVRVAQLLASEVYKVYQKTEPKDLLPRGEKKFVDLSLERIASGFPGKIAPTEIVRYTETGDIGPLAGGEGIAIFHLASVPDPATILANLGQADKWEKAQVGQHVAYRTQFRGFCIDEKVVVSGSWEILEPILKRGGEPVLDANVREALDQADWSKTSVKVDAHSTWKTHNFPQGAMAVVFTPTAVLNQPMREIVTHEVHWSAGLTSRSLLTQKEAVLLAQRQLEAEAAVKTLPQRTDSAEMAGILKRIQLKQAGAQLSVIVDPENRTTR